MRKTWGIIGLIIAVIGLYLCATTVGAANVQIGLWPLPGSIALPPAPALLVAANLGALFIVALYALFSREETDQAPAAAANIELRSRPLVQASGILVAVTAGMLLIVAVAMDRINPVNAALAYGLGWLAAIATLNAISGLARGDGVAFDSYWGGLGGAQGGWRVSPLAISLVLALVLVSATVAVATGIGPATGEKKDANAGRADAGKKDAGKDAGNSADADNASGGIAAAADNMADAAGNAATGNVQ